MLPSDVARCPGEYPLNGVVVQCQQRTSCLRWLSRDAGDVWFQPRVDERMGCFDKLTGYGALLCEWIDRGEIG